MGVGAGLYIYDVVIKKFTFAISSRDEYPVTVYNSNTININNVHCAVIMAKSLLEFTI